MNASGIPAEYDFQQRGYRFVKIIGSGQFGKAVLVRHMESGTLRVAKMVDLSLEQTEKQLCLQEADITHRLQHPHIVRSFEAFINNETNLVIIMEYCEGGDMASCLTNMRAAGVTFTEEELVLMLHQLLVALSFIHEQQILHRDLKPSNILIAKNGGLKVADFGICRTLTGTCASAKTCIGSPPYMPPEMCQRKNYTYNSDMWSLGCLFYEMACLRPAFHGDNIMALAWNVCFENPPALSSQYSPELRALIRSLLSKEPSQRMSAEQVLHTPYLMRMTGRLQIPPVGPILIAVRINKKQRTNNDPRIDNGSRTPLRTSENALPAFVGVPSNREVYQEDDEENDGSISRLDSAPCVPAPSVGRYEVPKTALLTEVAQPFRSSSGESPRDNKPDAMSVFLSGGRAWMPSSKVEKLLWAQLILQRLQDGALRMDVSIIEALVISHRDWSSVVGAKSTSRASPILSKRSPARSPLKMSRDRTNVTTTATTLPSFASGISNEALTEDCAVARQFLLHFLKKLQLRQWSSVMTTAAGGNDRVNSPLNDVGTPVSAVNCASLWERISKKATSINDSQRPRAVPAPFTTPAVEKIEDLINARVDLDWLLRTEARFRLGVAQFEYEFMISFVNEFLSEKQPEADFNADRITYWRLIDLWQLWADTSLASSGGWLLDASHFLGAKASDSLSAFLKARFISAENTDSSLKQPSPPGRSSEEPDNDSRPNLCRRDVSRRWDSGHIGMCDPQGLFESRADVRRCDLGVVVGTMYEILANALLEPNWREIGPCAQPDLGKAVAHFRVFENDEEPLIDRDHLRSLLLYLRPQLGVPFDWLYNACVKDRDGNVFWLATLRCIAESVKTFEGHIPTAAFGTAHMEVFNNYHLNSPTASSDTTTLSKALQCNYFAQGGTNRASHGGNRPSAPLDYVSPSPESSSLGAPSTSSTSSGEVLRASHRSRDRSSLRKAPIRKVVSSSGSERAVARGRIRRQRRAQHRKKKRRPHGATKVSSSIRPPPLRTSSLSQQDPRWGAVPTKKLVSPPIEPLRGFLLATSSSSDDESTLWRPDLRHDPGLDSSCFSARPSPSDTLPLAYRPYSAVDLSRDLAAPNRLLELAARSMDIRTDTGRGCDPEDDPRSRAPASPTSAASTGLPSRANTSRRKSVTVLAPQNHSSPHALSARMDLRPSAPPFLPPSMLLPPSRRRGAEPDLMERSAEDVEEDDKARLDAVLAALVDEQRAPYRIKVRPQSDLDPSAVTRVDMEDIQKMRAFDAETTSANDLVMFFDGVPWDHAAYHHLQSARGSFDDRPVRPSCGTRSSQDIIKIYDGRGMIEPRSTDGRVYDCRFPHDGRSRAEHRMDLGGALVEKSVRRVESGEPPLFRRPTAMTAPELAWQPETPSSDANNPSANSSAAGLNQCRPPVLETEVSRKLKRRLVQETLVVQKLLTALFQEDRIRPNRELGEMENYQQQFEMICSIDKTVCRCLDGFQSIWRECLLLEEHSRTYVSAELLSDRLLELFALLRRKAGRILMIASNLRTAIRKLAELAFSESGGISPQEVWLHFRSFTVDYAFKLNDQMKALMAIITAPGEDPRAFLARPSMQRQPASPKAAPTDFLPWPPDPDREYEAPRERHPFRCAIDPAQHSPHENYRDGMVGLFDSEPGGAIEPVKRTQGSAKARYMPSQGLSTASTCCFGGSPLGRSISRSSGYRSTRVPNAGFWPWSGRQPPFDNVSALSPHPQQHHFYAPHAAKQ